MTNDPATPLEGDHERRAFAKDRYKQALTGSLLSKVASVLLLLATLAAYRFLGLAKVGLYGSLVASVGWLATASLGCGPVVTLMIAEAVARRDKDGERKAFVANFWISVACMALFGLGLAVYFLVWNPSRLFAPDGLLYAQDLNWAAVVVLAQALVVLLLTATEISRDGYQETGRVARAASVGSLIALPVLLAAAWFTRSIAALALCGLLLPVAGRIWLAWRMVKVERPYLWPTFSGFDREAAWRIIRGNSAYSLVQIGSYANVPLLILMTRQYAGAAAAGGANLIYAGLFMQGITLITQLTQPIVPSLREGFARGDHEWTTRVLRKFVAMACLSATVIGVGLALVGPVVARLVLPNYIMPTGLMWLVAIHFVLFALEFVFTNAVISVWRVLPPSLVVLGRTVVSTALMFWLVPRWHEQGASIALILGMGLTSAWILPVMLSKALKRTTVEPKTA